MILRLIRSDLTRQISLGFVIGAISLYLSAPGMAREAVKTSLAAAWSSL